MTFFQIGKKEKWPDNKGIRSIIVDCLMFFIPNQTNAIALYKASEFCFPMASYGLLRTASKMLP